MEVITVRKVFRDATNTRRGPGTRTTVYATEYPDVRMSTFDNTTGVKEGDKLNVTITKKGDFTNFKIIKGGSNGTSTNPDLEARVKKLEDAVFGKAAAEDQQDQDEFNDF